MTMLGLIVVDMEPTRSKQGESCGKYNEEETVNRGPTNESTTPPVALEVSDSCA